MPLTALLVTAFLEALDPGAPRVVACTFPAADASGHAISLAVEARPSLLDRAGQFRVFLHLGEGGDFDGLVQPIDRTPARDVLIRGRGSDAFYTIGLRDTGQAALNLFRLRSTADTRETETRSGACSGFETAFDTWLRS